MEQDFATCDVDNFMAAYLPFIPSNEDVINCIEMKLKPAGLMTKTEDSVFTNFQTTPVADCAASDFEDCTENDTYSPLEDIAAAVGTFNPSGRPRNTYRYSKMPRKTSISPEVDSEVYNEVDACFMSDQALNADGCRSSLVKAVPIAFSVSRTCKDRLQVSDLSYTYLAWNLRLLLH